MDIEEKQYNLKAIKLEVTHCCPLMCIHCSSNTDSSNATVMSFNTAKNILSQAIEMGVREVSFSGGEPLGWAAIGKAVLLCTEAGVSTEIYTSGNVDSIETTMKLLKNSGITKIIFSVYSANSEYHDAITKIRGSFRRTMTAVAQAIHHEVPVEFHFVPLSINYRGLTDIIKLAQGIGVEQISILRFVPQGRGENCFALTLNNTQNLELKNLIEGGMMDMKIRVGSPYNFLMVNNSPKCCAGRDRLTILPDSTIYPCDAFKQVKAEIIVGTEQFSRLDKWSLRECWEKSPYLQAVRSYLMSPFEEPCADCDNLDRCLSGCLAQKYIATGTLKKRSDPMCLRGYHGDVEPVGQK